MPRQRKKEEIAIRPFLCKIINQMSSERLFSSGIIRAILRRLNADEIFEAFTPDQRKEVLPILRRMVREDKRVAAARTRPG